MAGPAADNSMTRLDRFVLTLVISSVAALAPAAFAQSQNPSGAAPSNRPAERLSLEGVDNFARVGPALYRGAQPKGFAYNELKNAGVSIIVDFRNEPTEVAREKQQVEGLGMQFVSLPWSGHRGASHDQVAAFLNLLRDNPDKKIFVHCQRGADRTGMMVALYRMTFDHWTAEQAIEEMKQFHYRSFLLPNLERYVRAYPNLMAADPVFAGLTAAHDAIQP
jgi:protein tyrosine/serine phosphatase